MNNEYKGEVMFHRWEPDVLLIHKTRSSSSTLSNHVPRTIQSLSSLDDLRQSDVHDVLLVIRFNLLVVHIESR